MNGLSDIFKNASPDFLARNRGRASKLERCSKPVRVAKTQPKESPRQKFLVRITAVRVRLLDEDNLCEKFHVDLCRYAGALPGDEAGKTKIETTQRRAQKGEEEHTEIEIYEL